VGADRTAAAPTSDQWPRGETSPPEDRQRNLVPRPGWLRLAAVAQVLPALGDGLLAPDPLVN